MEYFSVVHNKPKIDVTDEINNNNDEIFMMFWKDFLFFFY